MKDIKEKRITYHPETNKREDIKKNNPERYMFEIAFCPYVVDKVNYRERPENNTCLSFFECFKSSKSNTFPMIDLDMLGDYTGKLDKKINTAEENTMARKRGQTFETNIEGTESKVTAENSLEADLDLAYDENSTKA